MPRALVSVVLAVVSLAAAAATAAAAPSTDRAGQEILAAAIRSGGEVVADGRSTLVWRAAPGELRVADDAVPLAKARAVPVPAGCRPTAIGAGLAALACDLPPVIRLLDLATGALIEETGVRVANALRTDIEAPKVTGIGRRQLAIQVEYMAPHGGWLPSFMIDRRTGARRAPAESRRTVWSLDEATGRRTLCDGLRRRRGTFLVGDEDDPMPSFGYWGVAYAWPYLLEEGPSRSVIGRCGRRGRISVGIHGSLSGLTSRYAWFSQDRTRRIWTIELPSGRRRHHTLPFEIGTFSSVEATRRRLVVTDAGTVTPAAAHTVLLTP